MGRKSKHNQYFNNDIITSAIMEYQATGNAKVFEPYLKQLEHIILGVINYYEMFRYAEVEDMIQEGYIVILSCLKTFDYTRRSKLFNYLTNAVYFRLIDYTKRMSRYKKQLSYIENCNSTEDDGYEITPSESFTPSYESNPNFDYTLKLNEDVDPDSPLGKIVVILEDLINTPNRCVFEIEDVINYIMRESKTSRLQVEHALQEITRIKE